MCAVTLFAASALAQKRVNMYSDCPENIVPFMYTSPNGQYACGYSQGYAILYSATTNTSEYLGEQYIDCYTLNGVNDKGEAVGSYAAGIDQTASKPIIYKNGEREELPLPEGHEIGGATGISADGTVVVGWALKGMHSTPCVWKNGELTVLKFPAKDPYGVADTDATALGVSADGKIIIGRFVMHEGFAIPALWTDWDKECILPCLDKQFHLDDPITMEPPVASDYITVEYVEGGDNTLYYQQVAEWEKVSTAWYNAKRAFETDFEIDDKATVMSPNGKYLGTTTKSGETGYIEVENDTYHLIQPADCLLLTITDKADACIATPYFSPIRNSSIYFNESKAYISFDKYIKDEYNFDIINDEENGIYSVSGYENANGSAVMSNDCKVFYTYLGGGPGVPLYNFRIGLDDGQSVGTMKVRNIAYVNGQLFLGEEPADVEICNLSGAVLYRAQQVTSVRTELPSGIYVIKALKSDGQAMRKIAVK